MLQLWNCMSQSRLRSVWIICSHNQTSHLVPVSSVLTPQLQLTFAAQRPPLQSRLSLVFAILHADEAWCWQVPIAGQPTSLPQFVGLANDTLYSLYLVQQDLRQPTPNM